MADLAYNDLVAAQTSSPPQYDQQGMLVPGTGGLPAPTVVTSQPYRTTINNNVNSLSQIESSLSQPTSSPTALQTVYSTRQDLQGLYNPDGTAKNPNDPKIAGIPTLQDWATKFGVNEEELLKTGLNALPTNNLVVGHVAIDTERIAM